MNMNDNISFKDSHGEKHGLRGHVSIYREDPKTKDLSLWDESDNIIPISGYQWILMKMFNLYLDSKHGLSYETDQQLQQDTTIIIPDLNYSNQLNIGADPSDYTTMESNIAENHFIQGFMVGNGGGSEDGITAKNTDYSFTKLRNPIPFQQTDSKLDPSIANQYLGVYRLPSSSAKSYYIKKFDKTPKIIHSWWRSDQAWDYIDPVTQSDLGPDNQTAPKTNRIESYVDCSLSISDTDCQSFFTNNGNNQSPIINELGLVAFDATFGQREIMSKLYNQYVKRLLNGIFAHMNDDEYTDFEISEINAINSEVIDVLDPFIDAHSQNNLNAFYASLVSLKSMIDAGAFEIHIIKDQLVLDTNIKVEAFYNQRGEYQYENDKFMYYIDQIDYSDEEMEHAQRIKLITYYTFKSIPIQSNTRWLINYRLYCN